MFCCQFVGVCDIFPIKWIFIEIKRALSINNLYGFFLKYYVIENNEFYNRPNATVTFDLNLYEGKMLLLLLSCCCCWLLFNVTTNHCRYLFSAWFSITNWDLGSFVVDNIIITCSCSLATNFSHGFASTKFPGTKFYQRSAKFKSRNEITSLFLLLLFM